MTYSIQHFNQFKYSGCVTTAETILIEAQSTVEFLNKVQNRPENTIYVVSVSPQTIASLSASTGFTMEEVYFKLNTLFTKKLGIDYFFDTNFSRDISLIEQANEFVNRFKNNTSLPMIASSCPGWICYAEKTLGDLALPHISTTKSPQQIMGTLVKTFLPSRILNYHDKSITPDNIYHVTIMPCFDKKLESLRKEFLNSIYNSYDVDLVLTTMEIPELLEKLNIDFITLEKTPVQPIFNNINENGTLLGQHGVSGGFAEFIFKYAAKEIFNTEVKEVEFVRVKRRNNDLMECKLVIDGEEVLNFCTAYGFRNIQNIVSQLRKNNCKYHYIEVMACPSGCINGGGQIKPTLPMTPQKLLQLVHEKYKNQIERQPQDNPFVKEFYDSWIKALPYSEASIQLLHTEYHPVPKMEEKNPLTIQW